MAPHDRDDELATLLDELRSQHSSGTLDPNSLHASHPELASEVMDLLVAESLLADAVADWRCLTPPMTASIGGSGVDTSAEGDVGPAESIPEMLGRYRIRRCLGYGGMGAVYEAHDPQLNRTVAIKVPFFSGSSERQERARRRFLRESHAAAAVEHAHVCQIYDAGEQDGRPYVVMAFVAGESLADRLKRGRFDDEAQAARLIGSVAEALAAVHARGIVHRDIKPANILLQASEAGGAITPKLTDFGLARRDEEDEALTADGTLVGTPAYMAPEQASGGEVTFRSDIYGLGAVLYEMLSGRRPYEGTITKVLSLVVSQPVEPLRAIRPDIDPSLDQLVARAMARDPKDRFPDATSFANALTNWSRGESVPDTIELPAPRPRPVRRGPLIAGLGVLAMLLVVGLVLVVNGGKQHTGPSLPEVPDVVENSNRPAATHRGDITVFVWKKRDAAGNFDGAPRELRQLGVLPLAPGDGLRIEARLLDRPAHMYVLWLDTEGKVTPLFPWVDNTWTIDATLDVPRKELVLPPEGAAPLGGGPAGIESLILLVRDSPLPTDRDLAADIGKLPPQNGLDLGSAVWIENGVVVRGELHRGPIKLNEAKAVNDPVLRTQQFVREKFSELFPYSRAVCFSNRGDK